jgi:hypothetical protein
LAWAIDREKSSSFASPLSSVDEGGMDLEMGNGNGIEGYGDGGHCFALYSGDRAGGLAS